MRPAQSFVSSRDGVKVAVHDFGGDGPDLLLAHATGLHGRVWDPVVAHLVDRFRCVALHLERKLVGADPRGHQVRLVAVARASSNSIAG